MLICSTVFGKDVGVHILYHIWTINIVYSRGKKNYNLNIRQIKAKDDSVLVKNAFNLLVSLLLL